MGKIFYRGIIAALSVAWLAIGVSLTWARMATVNIEPVVFTGMPAPGTNIRFSGGSRVSLNNNGQMGFICSLFLPEATTGWGGGICTGTPNNLVFMARTGQPAPGTNGAPFLTFGHPLFGESGEVAVKVELESGASATRGIDATGLWAGTPNNVRLIARQGDVAPGTGGTAIFHFYPLPNANPINPAMNAAGRVAISGRLSSITRNLDKGSGIWVENNPGTLTHIAHTGEIAPGTGGGTFFGVEFPSINDNDEITFHSTFLTGSSTGSGLWKWDGSTLGVVARTGVTDPAAGGPGGGLRFIGFTSFPKLNESGAVAFSAKLSDSAGTKGIWVKSGGTLTQVIRTGDPAPGTDGKTFFDFGPAATIFLPGPFSPVINSVGQVAFFAGLSDGSKSIWRWDNGVLTLIARTGVTDPANGGPGGGGTFSNFDGTSTTSPFFAGPVLSGNGAITFEATLLDGRRGIWLWDDKETIPVVRTGDLLTVAGEARQVTNLNLQEFSGNDDGHYSGANDHLEVAFRLDFAPTSTSSFFDGIFLARVKSQPVADAGSDQTVNEGEVVALDGSNSRDLDGDALTYSWEQLAGTAAVLSGPNTPTPTFTAPNVPAGGEVLTFRLTVSDDERDDVDTVNITVKNVNHAPVADAGVDQTVQEESTVTLDGSSSFDPDAESLSFGWVQTGGALVTLTDAHTAQPTFTAPLVGSAGETLTFELTVSDGIDSAADTVVVLVENLNHAPFAEAGDNQTVDEGSGVTLDATQSNDPDGDTITYSWTQLSGPGVTLSDPSSATSAFTSPLVSSGGATLVFQLIVNDGDLSSAPATVTITVQDLNDPPACDLAHAGPELLWPPNHKLVPIGIVGVTDPNNDSVTLTITNVTQDEPVQGLGDGDTSPDAVLQGSEVLLRAERAGNGNGRVYRVSFTANDGQNGSCTGSVTICVPQNSKAPTCVDSGQSYNSQQP